ncbi:MAG: alanyl-tRNA editing protein [Anaerolineae bacterium]|nr:alanyl-tRNA editing protein [Anaerolineae bacterium]
MTELLYQRDSYLRGFDATVLDVVEGRALRLDRTAYYPGGGGQPHDVGLLRAGGIEFAIERVSRQGEHVLHWVAGEQLPAVGARVAGEIDWEPRYRLMRTHTALHVLCGVVWRDYGAQVTGGNMEPLAGRMDFEFETLHKELVQEIEERVNVEIQRAHEVRVDILPRAEAFQIPDLIRTKINLLPEGITEVRVVEIVGLDLQADGGTHVANTREVGPVRVVRYESKGRINKRLHIALDA